MRGLASPTFAAVSVTTISSVPKMSGHLIETLILLGPFFARWTASTSPLWKDGISPYFAIKRSAPGKQQIACCLPPSALFPLPAPL